MTEFSGKTALVVGLARSGVAAAVVLTELGANVLANDIKQEDQLEREVKTLSAIGIELHLGIVPDSLISRADFIVISPGVPIDSPFVNAAREMDKEVMSEVELAYRLCNAPILAITGTNGKTTTTALTGEMLRSSGIITHVAGNIGIPLVSKARETLPGHVVVAEISSFQLEGIRYFHPQVCAVLNITEDHLNRHKTMKNYIAAKARIFENTSPKDWVVLNADDDVVCSLLPCIKAKVLLFSRQKALDYGAWVEDGTIIVNIGEGRVPICAVDEIFLPGEHNTQNALAAILMAMIVGVAPELIAEVLRTFRGVEHRIELVEEIKGVKFYNDSKATNPDAAIKAIKAMSGPTVLIAGGMDKGSDFNEFIDAFENTITHLVVLGETATKISMTAREKRFDNVVEAKTLQEAVEKAFFFAIPNGNVLLSPACASWDMFIDYEHRGRVFKEAVRSLDEH